MAPDLQVSTRDAPRAGEEITVARRRVATAHCGASIAASGSAPRILARLSAPQAYALSSFIVLLCFFASVVPSPLYNSYSAIWHLRPSTITLVFATYAIAVFAALLFVGRASDQVGR